jgi:predicted flap endonuclease-1-like 5' DNA nuclease
MVSMTYAIADLSAVDQESIASLKKVGIRTTARLLEFAKDAKGRKLLAEKTGIPEKNILRWTNLSDTMRIRGVGEDYAVLLQAAGVTTLKELKYRNPAKLAKAMAEANAKRKLVRVLPSDRAVVRWVGEANKLQIKISY